MPTLLMSVLIFLIGYALVYYFADILIDKLKDISKILRVSPFLIGLLILGIDVEETIASIQGAAVGLPLVSVGNIVGNSIIAFTLCFALPALFFTLKLDHLPRKYLILMILLVVNVLLMVLFGQYTWLFGIIGLIIFVIYLTRNLYLYKKTHTTEIVIKDEEDDDEEEEDDDDDTDNTVEDDNDEIAENKKEFDKVEIDESEDSSDDHDDFYDKNKDKNTNISDKKTLRIASKKLLNKQILIGFIALVLVYIGGNLLIEGVRGLVENTIISESFYGLIVIAFATNVEEILLLVKAVKKHQEEIGLGAMIGKKIWNLGLTLGISGLIIQSAVYPQIFYWNAIILFVVDFYFLYLIARKQKLTRIHALILMVLFAVYLITNFSLIG